jgi:hypothetical protein
MEPTNAQSAPRDTPEHERKLPHIKSQIYIVLGLYE